jgi:hypothetical protein
MKNVKRFPQTHGMACIKGRWIGGVRDEFEKIITFPFDVLHGLLYEY